MSRGDRTALGDRMKEYELVWRTVLPRRLPLVVRVDGKAFHSYLRDAERPFDHVFAEQMGQVAVALCEQIQGAVFAYHQSDEISVLVWGRGRAEDHPWFGGVLQKTVSVSASIASTTLGALRGDRPVFDARAFVLPDAAEVGNYFLWRQRDAVRNSITMAAQAHFEPARLEHLTSGQRQELLWSEAHVNWDHYPVVCKRGQIAVRESGAREVTYTDRRTDTVHTTTAVRSWWHATPAPHFTLEPGGFLAGVLPLLTPPRPRARDDEA